MPEQMEKPILPEQNDTAARENFLQTVIHNAQIKAQSEKLMDDCRRFSHDYAFADFLVKAFGEKGPIVCAILNKYMDTLSSAAAKAYDITGVHVLFSYEDGINIQYALADEEPRDYNSLSSGERLLAFLTVSDLLHRIAGIPVLVLDDLDKLDLNNLDRLLTLLESVSTSYENIILAQGAMGLNDIDPEGMEIKDYGSGFVYVICIGDKYYGYMTSMFENSYFTPLRDGNFNYMSSEFDIRDGETVRIRCEHSSVNGGKQGYVNAPLIRTIYDVEDNDYDRLISISGLSPLSELSGELEDHPDDGAEAVFERNEKTWLVFRINGVYHVYVDDYKEIKKYGEYNSIADVKNVIYCFKLPEETDGIGDMYYSAPSPEEILTDPETGIQYVKDQLLISAAPEAEKNEIERIVKELDAEMIGYIELTNDYQIRFLHDMTIDELQKAADHLNSFPFIYNVTLNLYIETSFE